MLEEAAEHRAHADVLAQALDARHEGADRPHDQVDLGACLRGPVELLDDVGVGEVVDLDPDASGLTRLRCCGNGADVLDQPTPQVERCGEDLPELLRPAEARDEVEQVGDVRGDVRVGREQADVLVDPRSRRVVVAGADVDVALELVTLAPHDERRLRVDLHVREPVDDVDARLLERARPLDVAPLVEARLQLDDAHALLAVLGGAHQGRGECGVVARAVDGRLQRHDVRLVRRGPTNDSTLVANES